MGWQQLSRLSDLSALVVFVFSKEKTNPMADLHQQTAAHLRSSFQQTAHRLENVFSLRQFIIFIG